jgi:hypothetical protein
MKIKVNSDILIALKKLIKRYFLFLEFQGSKISSYDKAVYEELKKILNNKK